MRLSLRTRLLVAMGAVATVLVVAAVVVTRSTEAHLVDRVDAQLEATGPPGRFLCNRAPGPEGQRYSSLFLACAAPGGAFEVREVPDITEDPLPPPALTAEDVVAGADSGEPFTVGTEGSDLRYRLLVRVGERDRFVVVVGLPLDDVDAAVDRLVRFELAATVLVIAVLALVTFWVVRLGVRPLKQMTATAGAIAGGDLTHRVPDVVPGTEAGDLGVALNRMLGRIEEAFDERTRAEGRLRQFVADASHELRTPVTTIRGYAELYRAGALGDPGELGAAMRRTEQEAVRMGALIEDLLVLARLDEGRPLEREPVELAALADDAVRDASAVDPQRPITAVTGSPLVVTGDERRLRQVVANVVGNALVHTPPGTAVEVRAHRDGDRAVIEVTDEGPGMSPDVAARALERFYRADPSRSRHRGGSGLGLAIVDATVAAHGGTVSLRTAPGEGTTVRIELPADGPTANTESVSG